MLYPENTIKHCHVHFKVVSFRGIIIFFRRASSSIAHLSSLSPSEGDSACFLPMWPGFDFSLVPCVVWVCCLFSSWWMTRLFTGCCSFPPSRKTNLIIFFAVKTIYMQAGTGGLKLTLINFWTFFACCLVGLATQMEGWVRGGFPLRYWTSFFSFFRLFPVTEWEVAHDGKKQQASYFAYRHLMVSQ